MLMTFPIPYRKCCRWDRLRSAIYVFIIALLLIYFLNKFATQSKTEVWSRKYNRSKLKLLPEDKTVLLHMKKKEQGKLRIGSADPILRWNFSPQSVVLSFIHKTMFHRADHSTKKRSENTQLKQMLNRNITHFCPAFDEIIGFYGPLLMGMLLITNLKEIEVARAHPYINPGGHWKPKHCIARHKVAVIIPYRDRHDQLTRLLDFLFPILKRQNLNFRFIVAEQYGFGLFNKGKLMNAAFYLAKQLHVDCVIFHDVDMFPTDDRINYGCPQTPRHLGAYVNTLGYRLLYKEIVGGVLAISMDHFLAVNGYSNEFWGWGGEDDDMGLRILALNMSIERPQVDVARYVMLRHVKREDSNKNLTRRLLRNSHLRMIWDGVRKLTWKTRKVMKRPLYHHMYIDVGRAPPGWH